MTAPSEQTYSPDCERLAAELFPDPDPAVFPTLTGRQAPHHLSVFDGDDTLGHKSITLAERVTQPTMPWQQGNLRALLRRDDNACWTHSDAVLLCPRQNGKSEVILLRCLFGLFHLGEKIIYSVARWDPSGVELHERLVAMIMGEPSLRDRLAKKPTNSGQRGLIQLLNGGEMRTMTRSTDMVRGMTKLDLLICDEAYNLDQAAISATNYAQMAARDPQTIYTSSAVNATEHAKGHVLAGLRRQGLRRDEGIYFAEYMAPAEMPHDDPATWQYANPSYGVIANEAKMRKPLRTATTQAGRIAFGVEALGRGVWPVDEEIHEPVIPTEAWSDMTDLNVQLTGPVAVAVDRTPDRGTWAIAAAQRTTDGRVHEEIGYFRQAQPEAVVDYLLDLVELWDPCAIAIDAKSTANVLKPLLIEAGIEPEMTTSVTMSAACGGFLDAALGGKLSHSDQPMLTSAVIDVEKRFIGKSDTQFAWGGPSGAVIAPLVAATLAHWALQTFGVIVPKAAAPSMGGGIAAKQELSTDWAPKSTGIDALTMAF